MARTVAMASVTLLTAAASGFLPVLANYFSQVSVRSFSTPSSGMVGPPSPVTHGNIKPVVQPMGPAPVRTNANQNGTSQSQNAQLAQVKTDQQSANSSPLRILNLGSGTANFTFRHGSYDVYLLIDNQSGRTQSVALSLLVQDRRGAELKAIEIINPAVQNFKIGPYETRVQPVQIRFVNSSGVSSQEASCPENESPDEQTKACSETRMLPGTGLLRFVTTPDYGVDGKCQPKPSEEPCRELPNPGFLDQRVVILPPPLSTSKRVGLIIVSALVTSSLIVAITCISLRRKHILLLHRMGSATWSFGQSWGANVTIGAGLLGTVITLITFPENPHILDKGSYNLLQSLFAAVIALAPLVYGLIRRDVQANTNGIATTDSQGYVIMFLLAGGLVLWGAFGQLTALAILVREFVLSGDLAKLTGSVLEGVALFLFSLLVVYGLRSLYHTAKNLSAPAADAAGAQPAKLLPSGMPLPEPLKSDLKPPLPSWSVL